MDLTTITTVSRDITLLHPKTGEELGLVFHVLAPDCDEVTKISRAWQDKRLHPKQRNKAITADQIEVLTNNRIKAAVTGWTWTNETDNLAGDQPEFSKQALSAMLSDYGWIREFLSEECDDLTSFF